MAWEFVKTQIKFSSGRVFNSVGFVGSEAGSTKFYPQNLDYTVGSSVFPLVINSIPFSWSDIDSDGVTWSLNITDAGDDYANIEFRYGGFSKIINNTAFFHNNGLPQLFIPELFFNRAEGSDVATSVDLRMAFYYFSCSITSSNYLNGCFYQGSTLKASTLPAGTTFQDAYSRYLSDSILYSFAGIDYMESGAIRYFAFTERSYGVQYGYFANRWVETVATNLNILSSLSYSGYSSKPDLANCTMVINPPEFVYDGQEHVPEVSIYDGDTLLIEGDDYILSLSPDLINVGQKIALAIATAFGDYSGEIQGTWAIVPRYSDPYSPGGTTVPSTGPTDGNWELPEDDLAVGGSPFNDLATQLYRPYAMTAAQVASFSNQLWNTDILDVISRYFEKPTEVVISLMSFPFTVECENSEQINFNWISSWSSVYVLGHPITQEIQSLDFGYVDLERYSGLFYDYQPYSSVQLYLPYIGFVPLKMNEVVGKRIRLTYLVDVLSGDFTAVVETSALGTPEPEKTLPYIGFYQGNIARPMPLSQQDLFSLFKKGTEIAITGAVAATAGTVGAIEGLAAEKAVGESVQYMEQGLPQASVMASGRAEASKAMSQSAYKTFRRFGAATVANSMLSIGNASAPILRNGTIDGISGRTSGQEAFIVITVPNQNVPENQRILGYPTNQPGPLSKFSGYTEVRDIRLKIPNATESEIAEIESIVRGGIVI